MESVAFPRTATPDVLDQLVRQNIPPRFQQVSLTNYQPQSESQGVALETARRWLERAMDGQGPMLALVGPPGTGKSHLLYALAGSLYETWAAVDPKRRPRLPFVRPWYGFVDELRYGVSVRGEAGIRHAEASEVRAKWWDAPIALLDEIRPTSGTNFDDTELARFACHAYDHRHAVVITTNVNPLSSVVGPAAASRFTEVVIAGPDARKTS